MCVGLDLCEGEVKENFLDCLCCVGLVPKPGGEVLRSDHRLRAGTLSPQGLG